MNIAGIPSHQNLRHCQQASKRSMKDAHRTQSIREEGFFFGGGGTGAWDPTKKGNSFYYWFMSLISRLPFLESSEQRTAYSKNIIKYSKIQQWKQHTAPKEKKRREEEEEGEERRRGEGGVPDSSMFLLSLFSP